MTDERRYQDEEVRAIFAAAARGPEVAERSLAPEGGLTLPELREIGSEVGIPAERIDAAALALDRRPARVVPRRSVLGMPVAVGRVVDLPRALTDREWGIVLGEVRQTFRARGRAESHGDLREWSNGNLHVCVEPTESGYRLRLGTMKGTAFPMLTAGAAAMASGLYGAVLSAPILGDMAGPAAMIALGGAAAVGTLFRQSGWARQREQQMDYIAARTQALLAAPPDQG